MIRKCSIAINGDNRSREQSGHKWFGVGTKMGTVACALSHHSLQLIDFMEPPAGIEPATC